MCQPDGTRQPFTCSVHVCSASPPAGIRVVAGAGPEGQGDAVEGETLAGGEDCPAAPGGDASPDLADTRALTRENGELSLACLGSAGGFYRGV